MREVWRPLLLYDEDLTAKALRDPVAPAERSDAAMDKVHSRTLTDGTAAHGFPSLLHSLGGVVLNTVRVPGTFEAAATFDLVTTPDPTQQRALDLLKQIRI